MFNKFDINDVLDNKRKVFLKFGRYQGNDRLAIDIVDKESCNPYARATINTPEIAILNDNQIIIKNYSENKGMVDFFLDNELIEKDYGNFYVGHGGECCICTITNLLKTLAYQTLNC
jgi:hypothetical protein